MKLNSLTKRKIRAGLIHLLDTEGALDRASLLRRACEAAGLTKKEEADLSLDSKYNAMRAFAGAALDRLAAQGDVSAKDGVYRLEKEETVLVKEDACEATIRQALAGAPLTKNEVITRLEQRFNTGSTPSGKDDRSMYQAAEAVLKRLTREGTILYRDGRYKAAVAAPAGPVQDIEAFRAQFLARLHSLGGEFFEHFTMALLHKYYVKSGCTVLKCQVSGGSADGGVDGLAQTLDPLGFRETVMVQTKCRRQIHVTETEIRAFYGAVCALGGSRGIFVTTSVFHRSAQALLDTIENCVGIDGEKLFELALITRHGIRHTKAGYRFDESAFV